MFLAHSSSKCDSFCFVGIQSKWGIWGVHTEVLRAQVQPQESSCNTVQLKALYICSVYSQIVYTVSNCAECKISKTRSIAGHDCVHAQLSRGSLITDQYILVNCWPRICDWGYQLTDWTSCHAESKYESIHTQTGWQFCFQSDVLKGPLHRCYHWMLLVWPECKDETFR